MTPKVTLLPQVFSLQKHHFSLWPEDKDNQEPVQYRSYLPFLIKISTSVQPDFIHSLWGPAPLTFSLSITLWFPYLGHTVFLLTINSPISSRLINPVWKQTESQKSSKSRGVRQQSKAEDFPDIEAETMCFQGLRQPKAVLYIFMVHAKAHRGWESHQHRVAVTLGTNFFRIWDLLLGFSLFSYPISSNVGLSDTKNLCFNHSACARNRKVLAHVSPTVL